MFRQSDKSIFIFFLLVFILFIVQVSIRISNAYKQSNFSQNYLESGMNYTHGLTGFETLPTVVLKENQGPDDNEYDAKNRLLDLQNKCRFGHYLGEKNEPVSCASICNNNGDEFQYKFFPTEIIINQFSYKGAYCMPSEAAACNPHLGKIIYANNKYVCIPRYPHLFGGIGSNLIVGCNGSILDKMTNTTYRDAVPSTFRIQDVDEKLDNGEYRIVCTDQSDVLRNKLIPLNNGSRFEYVPNKCASLLYNAPTDTMPDYSTGNCNCGKHNANFKFDVKLPCTSCISIWGGSDPTTKGAKYAFSIARQCIDLHTDNSLYKEMKIPCSFDTIQNPTKNSCERAILLATNTYSPIALEEMNL